MSAPRLVPAQSEPLQSSSLSAKQLDSGSATQVAAAVDTAVELSNLPSEMVKQASAGADQLNPASEEPDVSEC